MAYSQAFRNPLKPQNASDSSSVKFPAFTVESSKLQPQFEAYKLVQETSSSPSWSSSSHPLPARPLDLAQLYGVSGSADIDGPGSAVLGLKETKERSLHQLLVPARRDSTLEAQDPFAAYIDRNGFIVALTFNLGTGKVIGNPVYRLFTLPKGNQDDFYNECLPSLCCVAPLIWVASDGLGRFFVLKFQKHAAASGIARWTASCVQECTFSVSPTGPRTPASIKAVAPSSKDDTCMLLLQSLRSRASKPSTKVTSGLGYKTKSSAATAAQGEDSNNTALFEVHCVKMKLPTTEIEDDAADAAVLTPLWSLSGSEPLIHIEVDAAQETFYLVAERPFSLPQSLRSAAASSSPSASSAPSKKLDRRSRPPPHYSWAQTSDTVTIVFDLPVNLDKSHIRAHFSIKGFSLSLSSTAHPKATIAELDANEEQDDPLLHAFELILSGRYVSRPTWAEIDAEGSVWTWEKMVGKTGHLAGRPTGLLTLHLGKKHEGTRWPHVFGARSHKAVNGNKPSKWEELSQKTRLTFQEARTMADCVTAGDVNGDIEQERADAEAQQADDDEDDVPETMDPSELLNMLEGMEKYTVDEESIEAGYGLDRTGIANGAYDQPSLLRDGLEDEDATVGQNLVVTRISEKAPHSEITVSRLPSDDLEHSSLLATHLPRAPLDGQEQFRNAIVVKHDLDGCVFEPSLHDKGWTHVDTAPAIAFVLASKRDAHRVYIHRRSSGQTVILAFEGAPRVTGISSNGNDATGLGAGNLFVYYAPTEPGATHGQSRVLRLGSGGESGIDTEATGASGALLGVCCVRLPVSATPDVQQDTLVCLCEKGLLLLTGVL